MVETAWDLGLIPRRRNLGENWRWSTVLKIQFIGLALALASFASAQTSTVQKEIQKQYDRWSIAYMANDIETMLDILAPTYTLTTSERDTMDYKTYVAYLKLRKAGPKDTTNHQTLIKKVVFKDQVAEVDAVESMKTAQAELHTGRILLSIHKHEYLDRWKQTNKGWRLLSTVTILESTKIQKKR